MELTNLIVLSISLLTTNVHRDNLGIAVSDPGVSNAAPVQRVVTTIQGEATIGFKLGDQIARLPQPLSFILSQDIRFERVPETNSVTPTNAASAPVRGARGRPKP